MPYSKHRNKAKTTALLYEYLVQPTVIALIIAQQDAVVHALPGITPGQTHLNGQELEQIIVIPTGAAPFAFQAGFGGAFLLEQVACDMAQNG